MLDIMKNKIFIIISFVFLFLGLISPFLTRFIFSESEYGVLGTVGDWLGGTSAPMLNLAGTILIIVTLRMQNEQLVITRDQVDKQNKIYEIERFENRLFQFIGLHHSIINEISVENVTGRKYFKVIIDKLKDEAREVCRKYNCDLPYDAIFREIDFKKLSEAFEKIYEEYIVYINHYFKNLYRTFDFIDINKSINYKEKENYAGIVKDQLSEYEIYLLFLYSRSGSCTKRCRNLLSNYYVFDKLTEENIVRVICNIV